MKNFYADFKSIERVKKESVSKKMANFKGK